MKKPKFTNKLPKVSVHRKKHSTAQQDAALPRITNETVAEHREEVLSTARKYIYPLQHSRHRIVIISVTIFVVAMMAFLSYTLLALYRFNTTSGFMYRVTSVLPFPAAKAGSSIVSYDDYLFQLRRNMHYYQTQQNIDFSQKDKQDILQSLRKRALDTVIEDAYVKQIAKKNGISVSRAEVESEIDLLKSQNRLGANDEVFEDVLQEFWGWSTDDFRRVLRQQLLAQKIETKLDSGARATADSVLAQVNAGGDFSTLAKQYTQDPDPAVKEAGGNYGFAIERSTKGVPPQVIDQLFKLEAGQTSGIIETANGLEIVKVLEKNPDGKIQAAHITIMVKPVLDYVKQQQNEDRTWRLIST